MAIPNSDLYSENIPPDGAHSPVVTYKHYSLWKTFKIFGQNEGSFFIVIFQNNLLSVYTGRKYKF